MYELYPHGHLYGMNPGTPYLFTVAGLGMLSITVLSIVSSAKVDDTVTLFLYSLGCFVLAVILQLAVWNNLTINS